MKWIEGGGDQNQRINGVHYADWALGRFMSAARETDWFADTLFVFTGDHGFGIPPLLTEAGLLHQHVPILFYGPEILGERQMVRHQVISQLDIEPTIIGLLGLDVAHQSFGRDVFSLPPGDLAAIELEHLQRMEKHLRGFVVTALNTLQGHHCAPK